jgi:hypothetical protein
MRTEQGEETLPLLQHSHAWGLEHISDSPAVTAGTPHTRAPCRPWSRVSAQLAGKNERDLFPNLAVCGRGVEFDHLPCLRPDLDAVGERIGRVADLHFTVSYRQSELIAIDKQPDDDVMQLD